MPRKLRVEFAGACYHVINRGSSRRNLFGEASAAEAFERTLGETAERFRWRVHAYVLMRNHFHIAVETQEPNLSESMKWLQGTWVRRCNGFRRAGGRPFQGRYKALLVEPGHTLAQVGHYIHLNPVRAGVVEPKKIRQFHWSSLENFPRKNRPQWLTSTTILSDAGELPDTPKGWLRYQSYLRVRSLEKGKSAELSRERLSRGWCVGSSEFRAEVKKELQSKDAALDLLRFAGLDARTLGPEKQELWEERLVRYAKAAKIDLKRLPAKRSAPDKVLLAAAMKLATSVANGWLAERLDMGQPATASQFVNRWLQDPKQKERVRSLLSRVKV